ncbi:MAG: tetratricopeptide repeat protein [Verrucomicrobiae bacterium]|nr:tetratricopeptide repeat protein [Verrucomicrobiae bacterium]
MKKGPFNSITLSGIGRCPCFWVVALAFVLRLNFLQNLAGSPFFDPIPGGNDRALYDELAQKIAAGHLFPSGVFEYMPLYPWFLGMIYSLAGNPNLYLAGWAGILMDTATTALIIQLARQTGVSATWSAAGGLLYAVFPTAIIYSAVGMPNTLNTLLLISWIVSASGLIDKTPRRTWFLSGLVAGITTLGFAGMLLINLAASLFWLVRFPRNAACLVIFWLGLSLPLSVTAIHNWRAEGRFVLVTAHGGFNFFMGNHENASGYPVQIAGFRGDAGSLLADARKEAERIAGHPLSAAEFSKHWSDQAWNFICSHPLQELRLIGLKLLKFWNRYEYDDLRLLPMLRLSGAAFTWPVWPSFAWLAWGGLLGLFMARSCNLLKISVLAGMTGIVLFFITARYRLTLAPPLAALAAAGAMQLVETLRSKKTPASRLLASLPAIGILMIVNLPLSPSMNFQALDHYNTAAYLLARGLPDAALEQAARGLREKGSWPDLHFVAGNAFFCQRRFAEAEAAYRQVLKLKPQDASAHFNLALASLEQKNKLTAINELTATLQIDPRHAKAGALLLELKEKRQIKPRPVARLPDAQNMTHSP